MPEPLTPEAVEAALVEAVSQEMEANAGES